MFAVVGPSSEGWKCREGKEMINYEKLQLI